MSWRERLRTPVGQLQLLGGTLAAASVFAVGVGTQTWWFSGYVREKYPEPAPEHLRLAARIAAGETPRAHPEELDGVYYLWMRRGPPEPTERLAVGLAATDSAWLCARVERTLVAGTLEQRRRSLELLAASGAGCAAHSLAWARGRIERLGPAELLTDLDAASRAISLPGR